ncbi:MAG: helix-turn-helix domain-containing protein [Lachnospiraceae bacterium]|nr:helix-turn-helix domain-containing protein [Lachnospiraceae bacterium]
MDYTKIGKKMQELRLGQGITQEQVAEDLNCTIAYVSNVENNRAKLNLRTLLYYSQLCNVPVDTILNAGLEQKNASTEEKELDTEMLLIFNTFGLQERKKIIKLLKTWQES